MDEAPVLLCYDGTPAARNAITAAGALLAGRRAVVLDVGPLEVVSEGFADDGLEAAEISRDVLDEAVARAEEGAGLARDAGFRAEPRGAIDGPTWRGVVDAADEIGAAVIVLGSRGLTGLHALVEGSVSQDVAKHAGRPVLIVPLPH